MRADWSGEADGRLVEVERRGSDLYIEGGRADWPARGHEGWGGTYTIEEVRHDPGILGEVPGLYDRVMRDLSARHLVVDAPTAVLHAGDDRHEVRFAIDGDELVAVPADVTGGDPHAVVDKDVVLAVATSIGEVVLTGAVAPTPRPDGRMTSALRRKYGPGAGLDTQPLHVRLDDWTVSP